MMRILLMMLLCPVMVLAVQQAGPGTAPADRDKERLDAIARAKTTVAGTLKIEESTLDLVSAKASTWPDSSLGCAEKDRMYAQVVTDGWTVILEHDGTRHEMHVAGKRVVACPSKAGGR
jgi:hypothetical protein